ncbi:hypothetical protein [Sphingomonas turrisvirgatae]|uniref:Uncharacterized protein n=1 Tax=Sphingomonas turrisvirgatae TaxID=1888892 RepID=A0A1E3LZT5_9SPHN|nr:hypothetical protein [Sphingomonas turrisvirgatae]ODP39238.1 hypothetical protein BFL28_10510 [Sphingomonas turrisvirgatae]
MSVEITQADRDAAAAITVSPELAEVLRGAGMDEHTYVQAFAKHRSTSTEEVERIKAALTPFANEAAEYDYGDGSGPALDDAPDASSLNEFNDLTVGDLRRAREALTAAHPKPEPVETQP